MEAAAGAAAAPSAASGEESILRPLFGGAIEARFPARFMDVSNIRQVPDNQEVFADADRDESVVVELLELKTDVTDADASRWFFHDLCSEQEASADCVLETTATLPPEDAPGLDAAVFKSYAVGRMAVAKAREGPGARNLVRCYLANLRLRNVGTDVLVTVYEPIFISQQSSSAAVVGAGRAPPAHAMNCMPASEVFRGIIQSFRVKDWNLFS